jgi:hypothetical protein
VDQLTDLEREVLDFERQRWERAGAESWSKISARWHLTAPAYAKLLDALIDRPAAYAHDPALISRLRRARNEIPQQREARRDSEPDQ